MATDAINYRQRICPILSVAVLRPPEDSRVVGANGAAPGRSLAAQPAMNCLGMHCMFALPAACDATGHVVDVACAVPALAATLANASNALIPLLASRIGVVPQPAQEAAKH